MNTGTSCISTIRVQPVSLLAGCPPSLVPVCKHLYRFPSSSYGAILSHCAGWLDAGSGSAVLEDWDGSGAPDTAAPSSC